MRLRFLFFVVVAALLAGCAGAAKPASTSSAAVPAPGADTGVIRGLVVDEEALPLVNVDVRLVERQGVAAITDTTGHFVIKDVVPGAYTARVEVPGYEPGEARTSVGAGETVNVTIALRSIPKPVPRVSAFIADAIIELGVNAFGVYYYDNSSGTQYRDIFYPVEQDAETAVVGLQWVATSPVSAKWMELAVWLSSDQCVNWCKLLATKVGRSPLVARADGVAAAMEGRTKLTINPYVEIEAPCVPATATTCAENPDAVVQVAQDQRLRVYTTIFYVDPAPEGYTPVPAA